MKRTALVFCFLIIFNGCGGGGKTTSTVPMVAPPVTQPTGQPVVEEEPEQPEQPEEPVVEEPPVQQRPWTPPAPDLDNKIGDVGRVEVAFERHGEFADLEKYFRELVASACAGYIGPYPCPRAVVDRFKAAPTVKVAGYASDENKQKVQEAIRIVNTVLPQGYKMVYSSEIVPFTRYGSIPQGEIHIGFQSDRYDHNLRSTLGYTRYVYDESTKVFDGTRVWIRTNHRVSEEYIVPVMVREFLHSLGLKGWVFDVPSIFNHRGERITGKTLTPTDRQALKALYTHYNNGDDALTMGPWINSRFDFTARLTSGCVGYCGPDVGGYLHFGVTYENGSGTPWVNGPTPTTDISRNSSLVPDPNLGEVRWKGAVIGVDSQQKLVSGDTLFDLNLDSLEGVVLFYNLRARDIHNTNGFNIDRGDVWGEGNLGGYRVQVNGNGFENASVGLRGSFYGHSHEFVGGTLQQYNLNAAFGAKR